MQKKFILNFAPTGLIPTKEMTPHVPLSPVEISENVLEAAALGANMVHLHARDPDSFMQKSSVVFEERIRI
jgi:3-keto-5-aminohexanoate cleavage enzyme